jgi:hypothetical protein
MARLQAFQPLNMAALPPWSGSTQEASATRIVVSDGARTVVYEGSFIYNSFGLSGGELTKLSYFDRGVLGYQVSDSYLSALTAANFINNGNLQTLLTFALVGNDALFGSAGNDRLLGYAGNDLISGGLGNDIIDGGSGDDVLIGGPGDDVLLGGDGIDTAIIGAARRQTTLVGNPASNLGATLNGPDGRDTLTSVEIVKFVDGWLAFSPFTTAGTVFRLYQAVLGRAPDPIGLGNWIAALEAGSLSLPSAAQAFVSSAEFGARFGALDSSGFLTLLYQNVLERAPDAVGFNNWRTALESGQQSVAQVVLGFSESSEFIQRTAPAFGGGVWAADPFAVNVLRIYETVLDRRPDPGGLLAWTTAHAGGMTIRDMIDGFMASAEFVSRYGSLSNESFVRLLYLNALDRPGEAEGIAAWTGALNAGSLSR